MAATLERESTDSSASSVSALARPRPAAEITLGLAVFAVYAIVNGLSWSGKAATAARHSDRLFRLEQSLHLDVEPALNRWLAPHHALRVFADYEYATTYVLSAFALLWWLYRRRPELYRWARTSFVWLNLAAIAMFAAYPLRPPRLWPDQGFVDTVRLGHTWGSWGSPLVGHANQLAAMPSLHFGWALWVSAVLARISGRARVQVISALHVALTLWVILATGNHYLLDAVVATALVWACVRLTPKSTEPPVAPADAFFLHVESAAAPQHVGGVVLLDLTTRGGVPPGQDEVIALVRQQLGELPRFRQVLGERGRHSWRRPVWRSGGGEPDWAWHVPLVDLHRPDGSPGGRPALDRLVGELAATLLPRDRPLWRLVVVHGVDVDTAAVVLLVHHVVADGIGTVAQALRLLTPRHEQRQLSNFREVGAWAAVRGVAVGLAQLATDGRPGDPLPSARAPGRGYARVEIPMREVRAVARAAKVRPDDVALTLVAGGLSRTLPGRDAVRSAVPLMMRDPTTAAEGNVTAAVLMDLPVDERSEADRLRAVAATSSRLRTPTRAMASRWVMQVTGTVFPAPLHRWFARTVYGRRFFSAIVSTMPGPPLQLWFAGARLEAAYPLLPLAPEAPVVVGGLGWNGVLCLGVSTDPVTVPAERLADGIRAAMAELLG